MPMSTEPLQRQPPITAPGPGAVVITSGSWRSACGMPPALWPAREDAQGDLLQQHSGTTQSAPAVPISQLSTARSQSQVFPQRLHTGSQLGDFSGSTSLGYWHDRVGCLTDNCLWALSGVIPGHETGDGR